MKKFTLFNLRPYQFILTSMNGMVYGLFATLIVSVILQTIATFFPEGDVIRITLTQWVALVRTLQGAAIGVGIAYALKLQGLKLISSVILGGLAATSGVGGLVTRADPVTIYLVVVLSLIVIDVLFKKSSTFDIFSIPLMAIVLGWALTVVLFPPINSFTTWLGVVIQEATELQPFLMGVVISVLMGIILTSPFSSAAIAAAINISGIAGGAALIGCTVNMIGFAVQGRKSNSIATTLSVGLGTSMLQFKNILKKPIIWLPTILVSAILGPIATMFIFTEVNGIGAGMGTSGLVGQFATLTTMGNTPEAWISIIVLQILLPIVFVYLVDLLFIRYKLYTAKDFQIE
jgi:uncharacterized membrane protein